MIRNVQLSDAKRIAEIYNPYIKDTIITFEEELVTEEDIADRIKYITAKNFPYIVYEENGDVVGYAYLSNW
ncbi:GNAT family N-acetyltransferase, partial [Dysgonomonas sp. GY617]|uniref:GNAT family N-acetyltransferase n=1 Tax=Dysgonomonas sp. GY617 TaxID=2780420 RepID=UPI001F54A75F